MNATNYIAWKIQHLASKVMTNEDVEGEEDNNAIDNNNLDINEWEMLSPMRPTS